MRKVNKLTVKQTIGFSYTTTDLVHFESDSKKSLIRIGEVGKQELVFDLTEETVFMLKELFGHMYSDLKAIQKGDEELTQ